MAHGASAEIAVVGNFGIIGIALFMGGETIPNRGVVQSAGNAYRLKPALLKKESASSGLAFRHCARFRFTELQYPLRFSCA
jgi:hypothetical protein